jgi:hypothetical protein
VFVDRSHAAKGRASGAPEEPFPPLIPVPRGKSHALLRPLLIVGGVVLIVGGALLGLVPGLPGVVLGVPGVFMVGIAVPPVGRWINRQEQKLPPKWRRRLRPKLWRKARRKVLDAR